MTLPLVILALITCFAGFIPFGEFVSSNGTAYHIHIDMKVACISIATAVCAIALATWMFAREDQRVPDSLASRFSGLHKAAYNRFYIDNAWLFVTKKIIFQCVSTPIAWFDRNVIDAFFNFCGNASQWVALKIRGMQSSHIQQYCIWFLAGVVVLTLILFF